MIRFKIERDVCFMKCEPGTMPQVQLYDHDPNGDRNYLIVLSPFLEDNDSIPSLVKNYNKLRILCGKMRKALLIAKSVNGYAEIWGDVKGPIDIALQEAKEVLGEVRE